MSNNVCTHHDHSEKERERDRLSVCVCVSVCVCDEETLSHRLCSQALALHFCLYLDIVQIVFFLVNLFEFDSDRST